MPCRVSLTLFRRGLRTAAASMGVSVRVLSGEESGRMGENSLLSSSSPESYVSLLVFAALRDILECKLCASASIGISNLNVSSSSMTSGLSMSSSYCTEGDLRCRRKSSVSFLSNFSLPSSRLLIQYILILSLGIVPQSNDELVIVMRGKSGVISFRNVRNPSFI